MRSDPEIEVEFTGTCYYIKRMGYTTIQYVGWLKRT